MSAEPSEAEREKALHVLAGERWCEEHRRWTKSADGRCALCRVIHVRERTHQPFFDSLLRGR